MNRKKEYERFKRIFSSLFDKYGYIVDKYVYDEEEFGNYEIVFKINDIKLRLIRDRGQVFLDVSSVF